MWKAIVKANCRRDSRSASSSIVILQDLSV